MANNIDMNKNGMLLVRNNPDTTKIVVDFFNKNMKPQPKKDITTESKPKINQ